MQSFQDLIDDFAFLDDWEDRYRYVIELGRELPEMDDADKTEVNKVRGCASQVWLTTNRSGDPGNPQLTFAADSDALIVKGLIAILLALFSGKTAREIMQTDALSMLGEVQLQENLSRQRANGLASMVQRIHAEAKASMEPAS
ncbi:MAG: SufE family protein [Hyphomicrobiales bacterium]